MNTQVELNEVQENSPLYVETRMRPKVVIRSLKYGSHISLGKTLHTTISNDNHKCCQIFLGNPTSYTVRSLTEKDKNDTKQYCVNNKKCFYVHCPYVANLANDISKKSSTLLTNLLTQIHDLPCSCVLHIGKVGELNTVVENINYLTTNNTLKPNTMKTNPFSLLLENAAGQGSEIGKTWDELRLLYEGLDKTSVGLCIDTQHLFASGMCDFTTHESVVKMFDNVENVCGHKPSLIHLNDSLTTYNSRVDRHENLKYGYIWSKNTESLHSLIRRCNQDNIDMVLETPDKHINEDLNLIRSFL